MKIIKILLGTVIGIYALAQLINLIFILAFMVNHEYKVSYIGGSMGAGLIAFVVSFLLFRSAFRAKAEKPQG